MRVSRLDIARAVRTLRRNWGFTTVAVLSLGLAIALNTTMYSVFDALVNPQTGLREPERLYRLSYYGNLRGRLPRGAVLDAVTRNVRGIEAITGMSPMFVGGQALAEHGRHLRDVAVNTVPANFFQVLGLRAKAGRFFTESDAGVQPAPVVLNERVANELFPGGEPAVGGIVDIEGQPRRVIGIVGVNGLRSTYWAGADVWSLPPPGRYFANIAIVRLAHGITRESVDQQLQFIAARLAAAAGDSPADSRFYLAPLVTQQLSFKGFHYALVGAVLAVLLVACSNLANLQLARGIGRSRELALHSALGASRRDIVAHLMVESGLLAAAGLVLGLVLTYWAVHATAATIPPAIADIVVAPQTSWRVLVFAAVVAILSLGAVGLLPAIRVSRADPNDLLKSGAGTGAHRRNRQRYGILVVLEIALSLTLLSGAALVLRSAWRIETIDYGFDPSRIAKAYAYGADTTGIVRSSALASEIVERLRLAPDVADAAVVFEGGIDGTGITVDDVSGASREVAAPMWGYRVVSPSYFHTLGLPIVAGRGFAEGEHDVDEVVVDRSTARTLWPNANPVGRMIKFGDWKSRQAWARVVGVVPDIRSSYSEMSDYFAGLPSEYRLGMAYRVVTSHDSIVASPRGYDFQVIARARHEPTRLLLTLRQQLTASSHPVRAAFTRSMLDVLGVTRQKTRHDFIAAIFGAFSMLATGLAALGVFGIVAHSVAERRREIGVRIALGARARNILGDVLREGNALALGGAALGLLMTKYDTVWLRAFYRDEEQYDAGLFAAMAALVFVVTVIAALIPAMRATRVDPVEALRND